MPAETLQLLEKARQYCAYQERSPQEVREKLRRMQADDSAISTIIAQLETENFLNEKRFATYYALSKLRNNKWGRYKITQGMRLKGLSEHTIKSSLNEIEQEEYLQILQKILAAKTIRENDAAKRKAKLARYAMQKGFEPALVWETINQLLAD